MVFENKFINLELLGKYFSIHPTPPSPPFTSPSLGRLQLFRAGLGSIVFPANTMTRSWDNTWNSPQNDQQKRVSLSILFTGRSFYVKRVYFVWYFMDFFPVQSCTRSSRSCQSNVFASAPQRWVPPKKLSLFLRNYKLLSFAARKRSALFI